MPATSSEPCTWRAASPSTPGCRAASSGSRACALRTASSTVPPYCPRTASCGTTLLRSQARGTCTTQPLSLRFGLQDWHLLFRLHVCVGVWGCAVLMLMASRQDTPRAPMLCTGRQVLLHTSACAGSLQQVTHARSSLLSMGSARLTKHRGRSTAHCPCSLGLDFQAGTL